MHKFAALPACSGELPACFGKTYYKGPGTLCNSCSLAVRNHRRTGKTYMSVLTRLYSMSSSICTAQFRKLSFSCLCKHETQSKIKLYVPMIFRHAANIFITFAVFSHFEFNLFDIFVLHAMTG